jgi:RimJ/RimL family protein N-acetyltransferase
MNIQPIILAGLLVRLEPICEAHVADLAAFGDDESIWRYMPFGQIRTPEQMAALVGDLLARQAQGTEFGFAVMALDIGRAIGSTRYLDIQPRNRALEIGGTWYAPAYQRTGVNTECKYLLLKHAFDKLDCKRVQFKTDLRNERSQRALERIGAVREGVLRKNLILPDGYARSSVYYSILADEWPAVKTLLEGLMKRTS